MMTEEEIFKILADAGVGWDDPDDPDAPKIPLYGDGDADRELPAARAMEAHFESQLRESQLAVEKIKAEALALREALAHQQFCGICAESWDDCIHGREAFELLSNTSATADQTVKRIEREALEKAIERLLGHYSPACNSFFFERKELHAAILGEKGQG